MAAEKKTHSEAFVPFCHGPPPPIIRCCGLCYPPEENLGAQNGVCLQPIRLVRAPSSAVSMIYARPLDEIVPICVEPSSLPAMVYLSSTFPMSTAWEMQHWIFDIDPRAVVLDVRIARGSSAYHRIELLNQGQAVYLAKTLRRHGVCGVYTVPPHNVVWASPNRNTHGIDGDELVELLNFKFGKVIDSFAFVGRHCRCVRIRCVDVCSAARVRRLLYELNMPNRWDVGK